MRDGLGMREHPEAVFSHPTHRFTQSRPHPVTVSPTHRPYRTSTASPSADTPFSSKLSIAAQ